MAKKRRSSSTSSPAEKTVAAPVPQLQPGTIQTTTLSFHHSGPLPDPRTFEYYDKVCPGAARDLMDMAKGEQKHRQRCELMDRRSHYLGQVLAFLLAFSGIGGGVFLISGGKDVTGFAMFLTSLAALVAASVWQKNQAAKNESEKEK